MATRQEYTMRTGAFAEIATIILRSRLPDARAAMD
jgi:hypothetical protein